VGSKRAADTPMTARRARRAGAIAATALVAAIAAYLVVMNVFLRTRMFRDAITSSSGSLLVEYRNAYSLFFGEAYLHHLRR
jgi:hypothetical protein